MGLKCPECGSRNTIIVDKDNIENVANSITACLGCFPIEKTKIETKFFVCKDCGYWEKVEVESKSNGIGSLFPVGSILA